MTELAQTVAHEIGHILVGYGHPDEEKGPAPLHGTDRKLRIMHSGDGLGEITVDGLPRKPFRGNHLVEGEWDAAEAWLKNEEDEHRLP